jgi:hypothetical protein
MLHAIAGGDVLAWFGAVSAGDNKGDVALINMGPNARNLLLVRITLFTSSVRIGVVVLFSFIVYEAIRLGCRQACRQPACRRCGYYLKGLRDPRCPECGLRV